MNVESEQREETFGLSYLQQASEKAESIMFVDVYVCEVYVFVDLPAEQKQKFSPTLLQTSAPI